MSYRQNVEQIALARERVDQELNLLLQAFPPDLRPKYIEIADRAHTSLYRPYGPDENIAHYARDFWSQLEIILPWQRELRSRLTEIEGIGNATVNRLYRLAYGRSPESPPGGKPSIRGWCSIAATIRENPEAMREAAMHREVTPISRPQIIRLRAELVSWQLA